MVLLSVALVMSLGQLDRDTTFVGRCSHRQELTSPTYPLRDRLKLVDATVKPSLFHASGEGTITEEMKKELQTTQRRMMRMIIQTNRKTGKCPVAAHAASVDDIAATKFQTTSHEDELEPWVDYMVRATHRA